MGSIQLWDIQAPITMQPPAYPRMWANTRADFATHAATSPSIRAPLREIERALCLPAKSVSLGERETLFCTKHQIVVWTYFNCRGSQSTPGSKSLAACRTSSLSTEKLRRCPAWATATRIHSIRGGSTMNGLGKAHRHECCGRAAAKSQV